MSENIRMTSTARKFGRAWLRRLIWILLRLNILLFLLSALTFCYVHERAALTADWTWDIRREIDMPAFERDGIRTPVNALRALVNAEYVFYDADDAVHAVPLRSYFDLFELPFGILLAIELIFLLEQGVSGRRVARRLLKPLDRMAQAARELSRAAAQKSAPAGGEKLQCLGGGHGRLYVNRDRFA